MKHAILVTTPKSQMKTAAEEARQCIEAGGGYYFRRFPTRPRELDVGSRIYYVEDGFVRGFALVDRVMRTEGEECDTTGKTWPPGTYAFMPAASWKWVRPIPYKGFQGWRYFDDTEVEVVGGWKDPRP